jgi:hypothetical protein
LTAATVNTGCPRRGLDAVRVNPLKNSSPKGRRFFDTSLRSLRLQIRIASLDLAVNGEDCA